MDRITGKVKWGAGIRTNGGIQGPGEESQRRKDLGGWRNVGEDQERSSRVMAEAHLRVKGDTVGARMRIDGGRLGRREGRGSETRMMILA